jgi:hypothetical protein
MNNYTIDWLEKKEWEGKKLINATLQGEGDVTIWEIDKDGKPFPGFADLMPGSQITGSIWVNPKNGKKTLYPPKPVGASSGGSFPRKPAVSQTEKNAGIKEAQDRKEESIAYFNATNSAIAIVSQLYDLRGGVPEATVKATLQSWRDWFLKEHHNYKEKPPF